MAHAAQRALTLRSQHRYEAFRMTNRLTRARSNVRSRKQGPGQVQRSTLMKRLIALSAIALAVQAAAPFALAQSSAPPLPALTPQQSSTVEQRLDPYRRQTEDRVARGEITADEADRLLRWREWQIARQVSGAASPPRQPGMVYDAPPPDYRAPRPPDYVVAEPPVVVAPPPYYYDYGPYYRPVVPYWAPRPYYWGPAICAGGFGRHFGGRICF
jgi:hypothetical protein